MATVDTGLGWYAEDRWLMNQAGAIGTLAIHSSAAGAEIPYASSVVGGQTDGFLWFYRADAVGYGYFWYTTQYPSRVCMYRITNASGSGIIIASDTGVHWANTYANSSQVFTGTLDHNVEHDCFLYVDQALGRYYTQLSTVMPEVGSVAEAVALYKGGTDVDYDKWSAGYSVTCICKWVTEVGADQYCSPVLISSEQNNTIYTRNSGIPSVPTTEHTYQGMTFYMRKAPLDTLTGTETLSTIHPVVDLGNLIVASNDFIFSEIARRSGLGAGYPPQEEDPYAPGGTSEPSSSEPDFSLDSDIVPMSSLPTYSFADVGFSRIYNPNQQQLKDLAHYLWTDTTFLQTVINHLKQILENPIEAVISLSRLPCSVANGTDEEVKIMYIGTGVSMPPVLNQFVEVNCGTVYIEEVYGSALDYNPYTQVTIYLPFIGQVQLDTDEVMGKTLTVKYRVDVVSGTCVAQVLVGDTVMYQYSGNCATNMPFNSADFSNYFAAGLAAVTGIAGAIAGGVGGAAAAASAASAAEPTVQSTGTALMVMPEPGALITGKDAQFARSMAAIGTPPPDFSAPVGSFGELEKKIIENSVKGVMGSKISVQHAGSFNGNGGVLGVRRPYVIIKRPRMCNPAQYGQYNGRPSMMYLSLGQISGYTEVQEIHLTGFSATNPELAEISKLLKGGVIL